MKNITKALQRPLYAVAALAMLVGITATAVVPGIVSAANYTDANNRSIKIGSGISGATTNYTVQFDVAATSIRSVVIDFCDSSPLFEDTCTQSNGLDASGAALAAQTGTSGWTLSSASQYQLEVSGASQNTGTTVTFEFSGVDNPSSYGTFYARIAAYTTQSPDYTSPTDITDETTNPPDGNLLYFGGIALSTTNQTVDITARVQEKLQFCVSKTDPGADCGAPDAADLVLGHGSPTILDDSATDTDTAVIQVSTNAQSGVVIRMKNSNSCGGLSRDGGSTCDIAPRGDTAAAITAGTAFFGLYCTPASGNMTAEAPYNGGTTTYGMDNTTANDNVSSTYGDTIVSSASAVNNENTTLTFGASASLTTPAGIYTASMDLIATGTF